VLLQAKYLARQLHILVLLTCFRLQNRSGFAFDSVIIDLLVPTALRALL
jgi:hypothetical protein